MTIHARYAAGQPLTDTAFPAFFLSKRSGDTSGSALTIAEQRNSVELTLLGARRLLLIDKARRQRNLRQCKAAYLTEDELRSVTLAILAAGAP